MQRPVRPQTGVTAPEGWDREFYDFVMSLRLKGDMKYILVKQDSNGTSVSLNLQALLDSISIPTSGGGKGGDASYSGYFSVVDDSDLSGETPIYRVKVFDGAVGKESTDAGPALINNQRKTVAAAEVEVSFGVNYIFMTASISGGVVGTPVIANYSSFDGPSLDGACAVLIATVYVFAGEVRVHQQQFGAITAFIFGDCDDE
jgi:hypothetical protein